MAVRRGGPPHQWAHRLSALPASGAAETLGRESPAIGLGFAEEAEEAAAAAVELAIEDRLERRMEREARHVLFDETPRSPLSVSDSRLWTRTAHRGSTSPRSSGLGTERRGWSWPRSERVHECVSSTHESHSVSERLRHVLPRV